MRKKILIIFFIFLLILGVAIAGFFSYHWQKNKKLEEVKKKIEEAINSYLSFGGLEEKFEILSFSKESGLLKIKVKIGEQEAEIFASQDGKYLFPLPIPLSELEKMKKQKKEENFPAKVEKREKPDVKLFVMSYCPFGVQMEKALLPVWELLKGKADFGIYFVDYIMHGKEEMEENLRQYCIQKEEKEKYLSYLKCFVEKGDWQECAKNAKIDLQKINDCEKDTDKEFKIRENFKETGYPPFNLHKELNEKYKVQGSPHFVLNDTTILIERSPEKIKEAICESFLNPPPECSQKLSDQIPSPGFGNQKGGGETGSCQ